MMARIYLICFSFLIALCGHLSHADTVAHAFATQVTTVTREAEVTNSTETRGNLLPVSSALSLQAATMRTGWALLLVCALIIVLYMVMKKRLGLPGTRRQDIRIEEIRQIMPKTHLALVKVEKKRLLLGITPGTITYLTELPEQNADQDNTELPSAVPTVSSFEQILRKEQ